MREKSITIVLILWMSLLEEQGGRGLKMGRIEWLRWKMGEQGAGGEQAAGRIK
jgi:hypothetical protein